MNGFTENGKAIFSLSVNGSLKYFRALEYIVSE